MRRLSKASVFGAIRRTAAIFVLAGAVSILVATMVIHALRLEFVTIVNQSGGPIQGGELRGVRGPDGRGFGPKYAVRPLPPGRSQTIWFPVAAPESGYEVKVRLSSGEVVAATNGYAVGWWMKDKIFISDDGMKFQY